MAEDAGAGATLESSLQHAASLFEREDSVEAEDTDAIESQQQDTSAPEQSEQPEDEAVDDDADLPDDVEEDDESTPDDEEEDDASKPEPRTIKVGDEELPEDEVARGYLRTADYTRKTQALADDRRSFESEKQAVSAERQQLAASLGQLTEALKRQTPEEPDWDTLQRENPDEFPKVWAAWQHHQSNVARIEQAHKAALEQVTRDQIERMNAHVEAERAKLVDAIPAWKDEAVATKERGALYEFAKTQGFSENELDAVTDHRVMLLLRKAYLHDQRQAAKPAVKAKIEKVKAATPGPSGAVKKQPMSEQTKAKLRLVKTGDVRDAAALFELMDD